MIRCFPDLFNRASWLMVSKAFLRSSNKLTLFLVPFVFLYKESATLNNDLIVECSLRCANGFLQKRLFAVR